MTTRRFLGTAAAAVALVLTLAGCIKTDMNLVLQPDDTVDGHVTVGLSRAVVEMTGTKPEDLLEQMGGDFLDGVEPSRVEPYEDDEFLGATTFFEGATLEAFTSPEGGVSIVREGDEFVVSGEADLAHEETQLGAQTSGVDVRIAITFPGPVSSHDGELEGTTVVWRPVPGKPTSLNARGSAVEPVPGPPVLMIVGIGLGVLVVVGAVVVLVLRRRTVGEVTTLAPHGAVFEPAAWSPAEQPQQPPHSPGHG